MAVKRGRRPGPTETPETIRAAATHQFAELGFDRATIRSIAAEAGVDPALVIHHFGSKQRLFIEAVQLPFPPEELIAQLARGPRSEVGERVLRFILSVLADEEARARWIGLIRSAVTEPEATRVFREILSTRIFRPLAEQLGMDEAPLRASLAGSQIVGVVMARHIVLIEPLASLEEERLVDTIAPTIQRYLTAPL
ncbi:MAG: TetR family transcriptional regulator [Gaiellaceae bacterium]|jgi:AcrR family transcriptional regulator